MRSVISIFIWFLCAGILPAHEAEFSTAGFFTLPNSGRIVYSMNPAWRFNKGDVPGAEHKDFDDSRWTVASLPHGIEYLPVEASGGVNYQGRVWYRKHFTPETALRGKRIMLYFEAIMGKSKVFVNGRLLKEHFGGYLPLSIDITDAVQWGVDNVISVLADNSDDPNYPPGKSQDVLDFTYNGGIYRDCWLVAYNAVHITDPNYENEVAGGGLLFTTERLSGKSAELLLKVQVRNETKNAFTGNVTYTLKDAKGGIAAQVKSSISINRGMANTCTTKMKVGLPQLWSPSSPYLYNLEVRVQDKNGAVIDGYRQRIGIRTIEFKGKDGFWLNGKPYGKPLIGANRHQDFALVGNALSNSIHWRDAKKLKDAGLDVIRNAHYPQDPAFMDACDELGLFVIINTPGWQFWNNAPIFGERVYSDIRNMIRRDRNHASVWMWEPILNETSYPKDFAGKAAKVVKSELPFASTYSACDAQNSGSEYFPVHFYQGLEPVPNNSDVTYFKREWGDNPDNWNAQNSPSRVGRNWGERPMLVQAQHYAHPPYEYTCYDLLYRIFPRSIGGTLWHAFDHQRGYHPDPFYGGLMDAYRQPKYSYYLFQAQRPPVISQSLAETGPMIYVAHAMTPFSDPDITVYSNCDEVRLTVAPANKVYTYKKDKNRKGMPSPVIVFPDVFHFMETKDTAYSVLAEGLMGGRVVARHRVKPAQRPDRIRLRLDDERLSLRADGSDFVTVIAEIVDKDGSVKRLNNQSIRFTISGEGRILGNGDIYANPVPVKWGSAPVLVQSTLNPGKIRIRASMQYNGERTPLAGELEFQSITAAQPIVCRSQEVELLKPIDTLTRESLEQDKIRDDEKLRETEKQQLDFGEKTTIELNK